MPTPRHPRHTTPHPPHHHTTRIPTPTPQHTPPDRHALPDRHTRPLHTHPTTPYLLPSKLYLYICTSPRPPAAHSHPALSSPLHPSVQLPTPLPCTLRSPFCRKVCTPSPKASSNPPVEIFCSKRRRRLILNILPRRHRVDNSVNSSVHSEEKA